MNNIEYLLKFILNSTTLRITNIKPLATANSIETFKKKYSKTRIEQGFVADLSLPEAPIFNVPLGPGTEHTVFYCDLAVGQHVYASREYALQYHPPSPYESYIVNTSSVPLEQVIEDRDPSTYNYILRDTSRVLPLYEITFIYDRDLEARAKTQNFCEMCTTETAVMFCLAERASFCKSCDHSIHNNEFTMRHQRYYFSQVGTKEFIQCVFHPEILVDYFCQTCNIPVCTHCKIQGGHAMPPYSEHKLIPYLDACEKLKEMVEEGETKLYQEEEVLKNYVVDLKKEVCEFTKKVENIKNLINEEYKSVMNELQAIVKKRYQVINTVYVDKLAKLTEINRMKEYPRLMTSSTLIKEFKNIFDQRGKVQVGDLKKFKCEGIDLRGKLSLHESDNECVVRLASQDRTRKSIELNAGTRSDKLSWFNKK
ncbi:E3 ubiquitin-protein ligase TRIM33 [Astathelohania contejeani]|uniref:E3 ubiquitin-protein ligase TRIM33 n=1 Tax=Astathelohania contejeani TaxID=164912 RepID=A0ABQ7I1G6_9MICR|nr:E3 ubiquitin-protein ligase TRIM33 [Thelohania contejeani]